MIPLLVLPNIEWGGSFDTESIKRFTCYDCPLNAYDLCEYAWDEYNTQGDCLADK